MTDAARAEAVAQAFADVFVVDGQEGIAELLRDASVVAVKRGHGDVAFEMRLWALRRFGCPERAGDAAHDRRCGAAAGAERSSALAGGRSS